VSRRAGAGIAAVALVVAWAGWVQPWAPRVPLLTQSGPFWATYGCPADGGTSGLLVADETNGTAIGPLRKPVLWPPGFTARRVGSEVQVLEGLGRVVATTGQTYVLDGGGDQAPYWCAMGARAIP
jgi:hypothetical protein